MIFIFGIDEKKDELDFSQMMICPACGQYGRMKAFVSYQALSIFFIPVFSWGRTYYLEASCCGAIFELDQDQERAMERGDLHLSEEELKTVFPGSGRERKCSCGFELKEDFEYCPGCGRRLK